MLTFDVLTLFSDLFSSHFKELPFKRAQQKNLIECKLTNLRDFALDKYGTVDDKPYGGGVGMLLMLEPIYNALNNIYVTYYQDEKLYTTKQADLIKITPPKKDKIIFVTPTGKTYNQEMAYDLAQYEHITFVCGRYEGIDARLSEIADVEEVSIGNYVLSGGELPALVIMESIVRLLPGVLEDTDALKTESFTEDYLEHPQYTRPENFHGLKVPEILLSGHHKNIEDWKKEKSRKIR